MKRLLSIMLCVIMLAAMGIGTALGLALMQGMYSTDWTVLMAGTTLSLLPIIIAFLLAQDLFVKGVMLSGMKD